MSEWSIFAACAVCATGALAFLKFVANDIELSNALLRQVERRFEKAARQRAQATPEKDAEEVITVGPSAASNG